MQMTSACARVLVIVAVSLFVAPCVAEGNRTKPIPVEVRCGGDDGLTMRLRDTLENAVKLSPYFSLSSRKIPGTLVITIPTNVGWEQFGRRTRVFYSVEFASADDQHIGKITGACWDDKLTICAAQIIKNAKVASRRVEAGEIRP
jgi:hypothetical protein